MIAKTGFTVGAVTKCPRCGGCGQTMRLEPYLRLPEHDKKPGIPVLGELVSQECRTCKGSGFIRQ